MNRKKSEGNAFFFADVFFRHHCRRDFSDFHRELFDRHVSLATVDLAKRRGQRLAIAAPRGSAKTTIVSLILLLHDILYSRERYIVIISSTLKQAMQRLRNARSEILSNERLIKTYERELSQKGEFHSQSICVNGVQVDVYGSGAEIRGISAGPWRPTKIILDDVEDSEGVESAAQREKLRDWFNEVVENLGDTYTNFIIVGTILHPESLLAELLKRPDFEGRLYKSIQTFSPEAELWAEWRRLYVDLTDPKRAATARDFFNRHREAMLRDTSVLWSEKESYYDLMTQLATLGRRAFYQEKQNEPLGNGTALFDSATARRFRREGPVLVMQRDTRDIRDTKDTRDARDVKDIKDAMDARKPNAIPDPEPEQSPPGSAERHAVSFRNPHSAIRKLPAPAPAAPGGVPLDSLHIAGFLDPALGRGAGERGRAARGDFAALAVVGASGDGRFFLLELWAKRATPTAQISAAFDFHERWGFQCFGVEGNCFQELLRHPLEEERERRRAEGRAFDLPVEMIQHRRNKMERIASLEPMISNGWLAFSEGLDEEFWCEFEAFPGGDHDDALDALEGAIDLARRWGGSPRSPRRTAHAPGKTPRGLREY